MPLDLADIPLLDHHCHALLSRAAPYTALEFQRFFSEGGDDGIVAEHTPNTVYFRWAVKELAHFLDCPPTIEAVLATRAAVPLQELGVRMLGEAHIPVLLVDYGLAGAERMSIAEMQASLPRCRIEPILRLETLAQELILKHETFGQMVEAFVATVEAPAGFVRPSRGVLLLAALCLVIMLAEGAMADWGGVYLTRELGTSTAVAALAFAAFSLMMAAGRFSGDHLVARVGGNRVVRAGGALVTVPSAAPRPGAPRRRAVAPVG